MENLLVGIVFVAVLIFIAFLLVNIFTEESAEKSAVLGRRPRRVGDIAGMNAKMYLSLGAFAFVFLFMGYYWLSEEQRRADAAEYQIHRGEERAIHSYAKNCATCHGASGQGIIGPSLDLNQIAERHGWDLNTPTDQKALDDFLRNTIVYGWPPVYRGDKPVMPNWGERTGGPLSDEQVHELVTMIKRNDPESWQAAAQLAPTTEPAPGGPVDQSDPVALGQSLYVSKGCTACHGRNLEGGVGTNLQNYKSKQQIAGVLPLNEENLQKWLANPPAVKPGTAMPNLSLSENEIKALTAFLLK